MKLIDKLAWDWYTEHGGIYATDVTKWKTGFLKALEMADKEYPGLDLTRVAQRETEPSDYLESEAAPQRETA